MDPASALVEVQDILEDLPVASHPAVELPVRDQGYLLRKYIHDKGNM